MAHQSFAKTVLGAVLEIAAKNNGEASCGDISSSILVQTRVEHKRLLNTLCDLYRTGKISRIRQGVYGPVTDEKQPDKREIMWRILKMRRRVTIDDLMEMAAVSADYASEWLRILVQREVVRKIQDPSQPSLWVLINDLAEMPQDDDKAERLRNIRLKKKKALARLDSISTALGDIRQILQTMEEE